MSKKVSELTYFSLKMNFTALFYLFTQLRENDVLKYSIHISLSQSRHSTTSISLLQCKFTLVTYMHGACPLPTDPDCNHLKPFKISEKMEINQWSNNFPRNFNFYHLLAAISNKCHNLLPAISKKCHNL